MENTLRQKGLSDQTMEDRAAQNRLLMQKMIDSTKQEKPAWDVDWPEPKK